eukprot:SM000218S06612  [mRNA]  locus=s218:140417:143566:- [translate_table: standard]
MDVQRALHAALALGALVAGDQALRAAFRAAGISFPAPLFGMFCIFAALSALDATWPSAAEAVDGAFTPGIDFINRHLSLFYVPSLVVLPLAVQGIPGAAALKIVAILVLGWAASLAITGLSAAQMRQIVRTKMEPAEPAAKPSPFTVQEVAGWSVAMAAGFVLALAKPTALGTVATTALPYFLAATVLGYILGSRMPPGARKLLHPIITCAVFADLAALLLAWASGATFSSVLGSYLTKSASNPGAGDLLMAFLGSVILSFAFAMFRQRKLVRRHAAEIFTAVIAGSIFSLYSTSLAGRLLQLEPSLTLAIVPRCVTVALALPIAGLLQAGHPSLTAAVVVVTGLVGANFGQFLMDCLGFGDPIARGLATASRRVLLLPLASLIPLSAHGLGTASMAAKEPEALPFCAIAYALTGISSSVLCTLPIVQQSLVALAGA